MRERRDHTPVRFVTEAIELSPEEAGALIRDASACRRETADLRGVVEKMNAQVGELLEDRTRGRTLIAIGRWAIGLSLGFLISGAGWMYNEQRSHDVRISRHDVELADVHDDFTRHEQSPGHEAGRGEVVQLRGDVRALQATLEDVRERVTRVDEQLRRRRRGD